METLVARGEKVRVLVRPTSKVAYLESLKVELVYGYLNNIQSLRKAIRNIERVYHCAALAADWGIWERFRSTNLTGVHNLLEATLEVGVRKFIHVSNTDVYGKPDYPADETTPYRLRSWPYGDTKIEGEQLVWTYFKKHHLPVTIVRPVNISGPRSITFVSDIVELLKSVSMIHIRNGGKPTGLAYVTNVVDVIIRAADNKHSVGQDTMLLTAQM